MTDMTLIEQRLSRLEELITTNDELDDRRLREAAIARRYGVGVRTIQNWRRDPKRNFPRAEVDARGWRYNWLSDLQRYDQECRKQTNSGD